MTSAPADPLFDQAGARWPSVPWSRTAFAHHLKGEEPPHPLDLYLGGAAGHRVSEAWEVIQEEFGPQTQRVLMRCPTADYTVEDLWAEAVARLFSDQPQEPPLADGRLPARIIRYRGRVALLNYLIVVARRIAIGRKRRMRPTLSLSQPQEDERRDAGAVADPTAPAPDEAAGEREETQALVRSLAAAFDRLTPEQQFLLAMVYRQGMKQKEAGDLLGWSPFKASRQMKAALQQLREGVAGHEDVEWTPALAAAWSGCWSGPWPGPQDSPAVASDGVDPSPETPA